MSDYKSKSLGKYFDKILGLKLREHRMRKNLSQQRAVDMYGGSRQWLGKVECGLTRPSVYTLYRYTTSLEIDLGELFEEIRLELNREP